MTSPSPSSSLPALPPLVASTHDHHLAAAIASSAGRLLIELRDNGLLTGAARGKAGDAVADRFIEHALRSLKPEDGYLCEESAPDPARLNKRRVWIIDPLDGTREYSESDEDRTDWAVHVALVIDGVPVAGAVALPALDTMFDTAQVAPLPPAPEGAMKIVVSRSREPALARRVAQALGAELVPLGSAGAKAMAVMRGEVHAYLHTGGQSEWDSCAPVAVALATGLHASRIDGSPCVYNRADISMPDLLICRPECADALLAAIREATAA